LSATSFTVVSSTEITAVSPAEGAATHYLLVTTPNGTSPEVVADQYTYQGPVITSISPSSGPITGGTTVTITGSGFTGATKVTFGALSATSFTVVSSTEITAVSPAEGAATHYLLVTTPNGTSPEVVADQYTYT
jgi:IPT/TIG domain